MADGYKLVLDVTQHRPVDLVRLGEARYARGFTNGSGAIVEVKRQAQASEVCSFCECIGCGDHCEDSCNVLCRLGGGRHCAGDRCSCLHTAGVLAPGRWYVSVDAAAGSSFTLQATLVAARALRMGEQAQRTLVGVGADSVGVAGSEGAAVRLRLELKTAPAY